MLSAIMLSVAPKPFKLSDVMLNINMQIVVLLNVIMVSVILLNVVAPFSPPKQTNLTGLMNPVIKWFS